MRDNVIILLPVSPNAPLYWGLWSNGAMEDTGQLALDEASVLSDKKLPVTLIFPGQNIRSFEHDLPKMNRREQAKAVLFSIEDKLSVPLENLHIALGNGILNEAEVKTVSVIDEELMHEAKAWALSMGLNVQRIAVDYQALDGIENAAVALSDRIISPGVLGHSLDPEWYSGAANPIDTATVLNMMASRVAQATNFMQGNFAPRSNLKSETKTWLQLGGLAAALGLAVIFFELAESKAIKLQADNIRTQTSALYAEQTGQAAPSNPARAVAQASKQGQITPTQFLTLSDISFRALQGFDDVSIERVSYQDSRSELQMRLIYPSFERADEVRDAMEAAGGEFIPGGVREQSGRFVGEAVLKLGGS